MTELTGRQSQLAAASQARERYIAGLERERERAYEDIVQAGITGTASDLAGTEAELIYQTGLGLADREYARKVQLILKGGRKL